MPIYKFTPRKAVLFAARAEEHAARTCSDIALAAAMATMAGIGRAWVESGGRAQARLEQKLETVVGRVADAGHGAIAVSYGRGLLAAMRGASPQHAALSAADASGDARSEAAWQEMLSSSMEIGDRAAIGRLMNTAAPRAKKKAKRKAKQHGGRHAKQHAKLVAPQYGLAA